MKKLMAMTFVLALAAVGCGKSGGGGSDLEALKKEACACKDAKCVEGVTKKMDALEEKFKDKKPSEAEMKLGEEIAECIGKAMGIDSK